MRPFESCSGTGSQPVSVDLWHARWAEQKCLSPCDQPVTSVNPSPGATKHHGLQTTFKS